MQLDRTYLKLNIKRKKSEAKDRVESRIFKAGKKRLVRFTGGIFNFDDDI